jgi:hypothetical protein
MIRTAAAAAAGLKDCQKQQQRQLDKHESSMYTSNCRVGVPQPDICPQLVKSKLMPAVGVAVFQQFMRSSTQSLLLTSAAAAAAARHVPQ